MFAKYGLRVGDKTVARFLRSRGYSLQAAQKTAEGKQHPDRDGQFEYINANAEKCLAQGIPFISVDTKKKELVGDFENAGRKWQPKASRRTSAFTSFRATLSERRSLWGLRCRYEQCLRHRWSGPRPRLSHRRRVSATEMSELNLARESFHGDWNYVIAPRTKTRS